MSLFAGFGFTLRCGNVAAILEFDENLKQVASFSVAGRRWDGWKFKAAVFFHFLYYYVLRIMYSELCIIIIIIIILIFIIIIDPYPQ